MKKAAFPIRRLNGGNPERGVTMILVALAMVAIIAMAALSIDVITLYLARQEAQRSADSAALARGAMPRPLWPICRGSLRSAAQWRMSGRRY